MLMCQGLKKVQSGSPGQLDFLGGQIIFKAYLPNGQGSVILLLIVMVSPWTHLVKNHESQSRTNESKLKKKNESKIKNAWAFVNQTVNLKTDSKTLYYSILKLKYSIVLLF